MLWRALLLCQLAGSGAFVVAPSAPRGTPRPTSTTRSAKKKAPAAGGFGGFGAAPKKGPSEKPLKSQVADAGKAYEKYHGEQAADVWIACRNTERWYLVGRAACPAGTDVAGAVQAQKALIFKLGQTLDRSLEQAPDGLVAATAPLDSAAAVADASAALSLVGRDAVPPAEFGYLPV
eukprot:CAMPEP_0119268062 /NCGR_PEP_ID=MMETSP1329-20130426/5973_1 /TAXON_ID=114041 /ORGANISM="Genus nov. species nov., Strain RCC1024" /LENGTH=176 /DNA_ID=CAMNT_0007268013 /DNA_START=251 /DNA_END=777 /DNA_ORIENTATION=-